MIPDSLLGRFAGHGAVQKYGDNLAGLKPAEGQDEVDIDDMVFETEELDALIQRGEWSFEREGGVGGTSILIKALMEYSNQTVEQVKAFLTGKDQKFKLSLRGNCRSGPERLPASGAEVHRGSAGSREGCQGDQGRHGRSSGRVGRNGRSGLGQRQTARHDSHARVEGRSESPTSAG